MKKVGILTVLAALAALPMLAAAQSKPNILVIWGDDIGQFNVSAYNQGVDRKSVV